MQTFPWFRFTLLTGALTGFGYGLMKWTVPTEEETYQRMAPDLRRQVDAVRAARLAQLAETKKHVEAQSVDTDDVKPIWADPPRK